MFHCKIYIFCHISLTENCMLFHFQYIYRVVHVLYFSVSCNGSKHCTQSTFISHREYMAWIHLWNVFSWAKSVHLQHRRQEYILLMHAGWCHGHPPPKKKFFSRRCTWQMEGLWPPSTEPTDDYYLWRALEVKIYLNALTARNERRYSLCNGKCKSKAPLHAEKHFHNMQVG